MSKSPVSTNLTVAAETAATLLPAHVVTAAEAAAFTSPDDFFDDNGPVLDELFNRVGETFCKLRAGFPYIVKLHDLVAARKRDSNNRLIVPVRGKYTWNEICHDLLHRDPRTVRDLLAEPKTAEQAAAEKAARLHAKHVKSNAAALAAHNAATSTDFSITDTAGNAIPVEQHEKILKQVAEAEAAKVGTVNARQLEKAKADGFAEGVSTQQTYVEKQEAAANTATETFYTLSFGHSFDGGDMAVFHYASIAEAQKALRRKFLKGRSIFKVEASYTVTPVTPPAEPPTAAKVSSRSEAAHKANATRKATEAKNLTGNTKARIAYMSNPPEKTEDTTQTCPQCGSQGCFRSGDGRMHCGKCRHKSRKGGCFPRKPKTEETLYNEVHSCIAGDNDYISFEEFTASEVAKAVQS